METQICTDCKIEKDIFNFTKNKNRDGSYYFYKSCKECRKYTIKKIQKTYYEKNKKSILEKERVFRLKNKEKIKEKRRVKAIEKRKIDIFFKLKENVSRAIRHYFIDGSSRIRHKEII